MNCVSDGKKTSFNVYLCLKQVLCICLFAFMAYKVESPVSQDW